MSFTLTNKKNKSISALSAGPHPNPYKPSSLSVKILSIIKSKKHTPSKNAATCKAYKIIVLSKCYSIRSMKGHYRTTNILDNISMKTVVYHKSNVLAQTKTNLTVVNLLAYVRLFIGVNSTLAQQQVNINLPCCHWNRVH